MDEWIDIKEDLPDGPGAIVIVKLHDGSERKCYYHHDKMSWLWFYTKEPTSHFQDYENHKFLHTVTHWKPITTIYKNEPTT